GSPVPPDGEGGVHAGNEGSELGVLIDGGLDSRLLHSEVEVAGATFLKQCVTELRTDGPVALECIDIGLRDPALQVTRDVLEVLGYLAVDVARQIEIEVVLLNLLEGDHPRVLRDFELLVEDVHDLVN